MLCGYWLIYIVAGVLGMVLDLMSLSLLALQATAYVSSVNMHCMLAVGCAVMLS